jgi:hypothetical protein
MVVKSEIQLLAKVTSYYLHEFFERPPLEGKIGYSKTLPQVTEMAV